MHLKQSDFGITTNDLKVPVNTVNWKLKFLATKAEMLQQPL